MKGHPSLVFFFSYIMEGKFKKWWSTIPLIPTNRTITSHVYILCKTTWLYDGEQLSYTTFIFYNVSGICTFYAWYIYTVQSKNTIDPKVIRLHTVKMQPI